MFCSPDLFWKPVTPARAFGLVSLFWDETMEDYFIKEKNPLITCRLIISLIHKKRILIILDFFLGVSSYLEISSRFLAIVLERLLILRFVPNMAISGCVGRPWIYFFNQRLKLEVSFPFQLNELQVESFNVIILLDDNFFHRVCFVFESFKSVADIHNLILYCLYLCFWCHPMRSLGFRTFVDIFFIFFITIFWYVFFEP